MLTINMADVILDPQTVNSYPTLRKQQCIIVLLIDRLNDIEPEIEFVTPYRI